MPKNLGLYNDNLSVPRKQDVDEIQEQINILNDNINGFVVAQDPTGITDTIPPTFGGYEVDSFVLKQNIIDNTNSTEVNSPLSANQGNVLNQKIEANVQNINENKVSIDNVNTQIEGINNSISELTNSLSTKLNISGGTLTGPVIAQSNTNYMMGQVRNIFLSIEAPTNDVGDNGDIWIVYGGVN